jgi:hypothetical protein
MRAGRLGWWCTRGRGAGARWEGELEVMAVYGHWDEESDALGGLECTPRLENVLKWRVGLPDAKMEVSGAGSVSANQGLEGKIHHDQKGKFGLRHATHSLQQNVQCITPTIHSSNQFCQQSNDSEVSRTFICFQVFTLKHLAMRDFSITTLSSPQANQRTPYELACLCDPLFRPLPHPRQAEPASKNDDI